MKRCNGCRNPKGAQRRRGLCDKCYMQMKRMLDRGEVTDDQLVEMGKFNPRRPSREGDLVREVRKKIAKSA